MRSAKMGPGEKARPRILFVDHTASLGGAQLALLRLIRALDQGRFEVHVVLFSDGPLAAQLRVAGATVEVLPLPESIVKTSRHAAGRNLFRFGTMFGVLLQILRLARFIRTRRIDLVHANSLKADLISGIAAKLVGTPLIWHIHDRLSEDYMPAMVARGICFLSRLLPQHLIVNSKSTLDTLRRTSVQSCDVIFPGINLADISTVAAGKSPDPAVGATVGLVGRISPTKGQDIFLRAASLVLKRYPKVRFQIVGGALFNDAAYEREIRALSESMSLGGSVEFTGFVNDVERRLAQLDVLVHASTTPEPFGQVVIEGMAAGVPLVAIGTGGIPEIISDGETGLLIPARDPGAMAAAICRILEEPDKSRLMVAEARKKVEELFTIQRTARMVEDLYERLLEPCGFSFVKGQLALI